MENWRIERLTKRRGESGREDFRGNKCLSGAKRERRMGRRNKKRQRKNEE